MLRVLGEKLRLQKGLKSKTQIVRRYLSDCEFRLQMTPSEIHLAWAAGVLALSASALWLYFKTYRRSDCPRADATRVALLTHKTDNAVLITNHEGLIEWINDGFTRVSGYSIEDVQGKSPGAVLLGPLHNAKAVQRIREGMNSIRPFAIEILCSHKRGHRYWLAINFTPVFDQMERFLNYVAVGFDVTARKRHEDELSRLHRRNELLLSAASDGIIGLDLQGSIIYVNPAAARLTYWDAAELIGKPASTIIAQLKAVKNRAADDDNFLTAVLQDGSVQLGDQDIFREKAGAAFPVEYSRAAIREGQSCIGTVVVFRDVTDVRQNETVRNNQARKAAIRADIGFALGANESLRNLLQKCAQSLVKHMDAAFARIWTLDSENSVLELQASAGLYTHLDGAHGRIPLGTHESGHSRQTRLATTHERSPERSPTSGQRVGET
jgi:PAS domain S-box-containing protein